LPPVVGQGCAVEPFNRDIIRRVDCKQLKSVRQIVGIDLEMHHDLEQCGGRVVGEINDPAPTGVPSRGRQKPSLPGKVGETGNAPHPHG